MNILSNIGAYLLIAALPAIACAQNNAPPAPLPLSQDRLGAFLTALNANRQSALFSGPKVSCTSAVRCDIRITVQDLFDKIGKLVSCASQVGEIHIPAIIGKKTEIHWTIDPPAPPTSATYTFEVGVGLIVFSDDDDATPKKPDKVTAAELIMPHQYKKKGGRVVYYPLVYQTIGANPPTLCASGDPQILND